MQKLFTYIILILLFTSCSKKTEYENFIFVTMGTVLTLTYPINQKQKIEGLYEYIEELSALITSDSDNISKSGANYTEISKITYNLLTDSANYKKISEGRFNATVSTVATLYGFPDKGNKIPDNISLEKAKYTFKNNNLDYYTENGKYFAKGNGLSVDMGAFAKGWIADQGAIYLKNKGVDNFIINAGGDMYLSGKKNKTLWRVGITDPDKVKNYVAAISLENIALATSGNYERFFIDDSGKRITHLFNGLTGDSVNSYKSVSVIADTVEKADAYSTIYYLSTLDEIKTKCVIDNTSVLIITLDNKFIKFCDWEKFE